MLGSKHDRHAKAQPPSSNGTALRSTNNTLILDSSTIVKSTLPKYKINDATNGRPVARLNPLDTNSQPRLGSSTNGRPRVDTSIGVPTSFQHSQRPLYQQRSSVGVITASSVSSGEVEITYRQNTQRRNSNIPGEVPNTTRRSNTQKSSAVAFVSPSPSVANSATMSVYGFAQHHGTRNYDERKRGIHSLPTSTVSRSQDHSAFTTYAKDPISSTFPLSNSITANNNAYLQQLTPCQKDQAADAFLPFSAYRDPTVLEKYIRDLQQFVGLDRKNSESHGLHNRTVETESAGLTAMEIGTQTVQVDMSGTEWNLFECTEARGIVPGEEIDGYDSDIEAEEELAALDWGSFDDVGAHRFNANESGKIIERKRPSGPDIDMMVLGKRMAEPGNHETEDEEVFLEEGVGKVGLFCSSSSSSEEERGPFHDRKQSRNRHHSKTPNPYSRPSIYTQSKPRPLSPRSNNSNTFRQTPPHNCIRPVPSCLSDIPNYTGSATNTPYSISNFSGGGARSPLSTPSTRMSTPSALSSSVDDLSSSSHSVSSYSTIPSSVSSPDSTKIAHLVTDGTRSAFSPTQHLFANLSDRKGERVSAESTGGHMGKGAEKEGEEEVKQEKVWDWKHMPFFHLERQRVGN